MNFVGQRLANYDIIECIGSGGYADVYLGDHHYLHTKIAIKILQSSDFSPKEQDEFLKEAKTISKLHHKHILRVMDYGIYREPDGLKRNIPYIFMTYAPLGTLRDAYPEGTHLLLDKIILFVNQVADALQFAHDQTSIVVHCDVKPENMLRITEDELLLSDFGIARDNHKTVEFSVVHGAAQPSVKVFGTPGYMAPELCEFGQISRSGDQYALAIVAYEWLTGHRPFNGDKLEVMMHHVKTPPSSIRAKRPDVPQAVEDVVMKALSKKISDRYVSVKEFAQALDEAVQVTQRAQVNRANMGNAQAGAVPPSKLKDAQAEAVSLPPKSKPEDAQAVPLPSKLKPEVAQAGPAMGAASPSPSNPKLEDARVNTEAVTPPDAKPEEAPAGPAAASPPKPQPENLQARAGGAAPPPVPENQLPKQPKPQVGPGAGAASPPKPKPADAQQQQQNAKAGAPPPRGNAGNPHAGAKAASPPRGNVGNTRAGAGAGGAASPPPPRGNAGNPQSNPRNQGSMFPGGVPQTPNATTVGSNPVHRPPQQQSGSHGFEEFKELFMIAPPLRIRRLFGRDPEFAKQNGKSFWYRGLNQLLIFLFSLILFALELPQIANAFIIGIVVGAIIFVSFRWSLQLRKPLMARIFLALTSFYYGFGVWAICDKLNSRIASVNQLNLIISWLWIIVVGLSIFWNHRFVKTRNP